MSTEKPQSVETASAKQRARPSPLNLATPTSASMNDIAMQIVSPGLPPLDSKMQKTVMMSRSIEAQQKQLIASCVHPTEPVSMLSDLPDNAEGSEGNDGSGEEGEGIEKMPKTEMKEDLRKPTEERSELGGNDGDVPEKQYTLAEKRLKRSKIPPPLNTASSKLVDPSIRSAPVRYRQAAPPHIPVAYGLRKVSPYTPYHGVPSYRYPRYVQRNPYSARRYPGVVLATPVTAGNPPRMRLPMRTVGHQSAKSPVPFVADMFPGEYQTQAPLSAQPLSAQKTTFGFAKERKDSTSHVRSLSCESKIASPLDEQMEREKEEQSGLEQTAIEDDSANTEIKPSKKVRGEIRIDSDVYNYDVFVGGDTKADKDSFLRVCSAAWEEHFQAKV